LLLRFVKLSMEIFVIVKSPNVDRSDDESDGEIDDETLNKLIIVTQTPPSLRKHPGGDRTGDFVPRSKMTAELAKVINDGLYFYEQELQDQGSKVEYYAVARRRKKTVAQDKPIMSEIVTLWCERNVYNIVVIVTSELQGF